LAFALGSVADLVLVSPGKRRSVIYGARLARILDLIFEDDRLNVYAGELEVRPPAAPTTGSSVAWRIPG
jgi:hypothetical protein